jgi:flavin-dependent dehydrogenase
MIADVLVIGAGPAGSATAWWLARAGKHVLLADRARFPRDKPCSEYMGPGAVARLERLGVMPALRDRGARPLNGTTVVAAHGARLTGLFSETRAHPNAGISLARTELDDALLAHARAAGVTVLEQHTAQDLLHNESGVRGARFRTGAGAILDLEARVTVGAGGLRSIVARKVGGLELGAAHRMGFVTHVRGMSGLGSTAEMLVSEAGYVGINPLGHGVANVALVVPSERAHAAKGRLDAFFMEELGRFPSLAGRIPSDGLLHPVHATGPFSARARQVVADGALLVGDAADFFDPFTGEGIFTALAGAELASAVLLEALESPGPVTRRRLASYVRARRRAFRGKWAVERLIGFGMLAPRLFDRAVARLGRRGRMAHTLIGVTADVLPARRVLNPLFLARMVV